MQSSMQQHSSSRLGRRGVAAHVLRPAAVCRVARPHREPFSSHQLVLGGTWYEDMVELLARDALSRAGASPRQHLVGIAGAPGSGKSTLSQLVCSRINELEGAGTAVVVPMDGFHYTKAQLAAFPDPSAAFARRGAHWTFDAAAFVACVRCIRQSGASAVPSFDHAIGDPVEGDIRVEPGNKVVLVEGNYILLDEQPWHQLKTMFDDAWFVDVPVEVAMKRVFARQTGNGIAADVSRGRIAGNDQPNADLVASTKRFARLVVPSSVPLRRHPGAA